MNKKSFKQYKIYVTGIAGMLGYGIFNTLKNKAEIYGIDILNIEIPGLIYPKLSLYDIDSVEKNILQVKPDVLIHTAALINVEECESNPEEATARPHKHCWLAGDQIGRCGGLS